MCHRLVCARQVSLGTFLPALPICPHGHPHTWVLWRAASMKMMLSFLLMAISQVLSLELALIHCIHASELDPLCCSLCLGHWRRLTLGRLVLLLRERCLQLLVSQLFQF